MELTEEEMRRFNGNINASFDDDEFDASPWRRTPTKIDILCRLILVLSVAFISCVILNKVLGSIIYLNPFITLIGMFVPIPAAIGIWWTGRWFNRYVFLKNSVAIDDARFISLVPILRNVPIEYVSSVRQAVGDVYGLPKEIVGPFDGPESLRGISFSGDPSLGLLIASGFEHLGTELDPKGLILFLLNNKDLIPQNIAEIIVLVYDYQRNNAGD